MIWVAYILVFLFAGYIFRNYYWRIAAAKWYGIEAIASVSRIEKVVRTTRGEEFPRRFYYAVFQAQNGLQNEARILNPHGRLVPGSRIRVKYLPERNDLAVLMEIMDK